MSRCRDVVEVVARALADRPDAVRVTEREHKGQTLVELFMAPGDLGRVIGRQGRTATAMRALVSATADLELYDYATDPLETKNLAGEQPEVVRRLRQMLESQPEALPQIRSADATNNPAGTKKKGRGAKKN